jgi:hypothetical protein
MARVNCTVEGERLARYKLPTTRYLPHVICKHDDKVDFG